MDTTVRKIELNWQKRISHEDFDEERKFLVENRGIYIWIFKGTPPRVTYVGETDRFIDRFVQHFSNVLTGRFNTYAMNPEDDFVNHLLIYCYNKRIDEIDKDKNKFYIPAKPENPDFKFTDTYFNEDLLKMHKIYLTNLDFAFATGNFMDNKVVRREVEGILIRGLIELYSKDAKVELLESEIKGSRQIPIGRISNRPSQSYDIEHQYDSLKVQLPEDITKIRGYNYESKKIEYKNEVN